MSDHGRIFPPRSYLDVFFYDEDDMMNGYLDYLPDELPPGPNHAPGYRWGWANRRKDHTSEPDGYEAIRHDFIGHCREHKGRHAAHGREEG